MRFTAGMGDSGETYLVGPDGLMRSQSRFSDAPTLLETKVDNLSVRDGQSGKSGARIVADYRGIPVLSVYAPLDFGGQPFVLLAEIERRRFSAKRSLRSWLPLQCSLASSLACWCCCSIGSCGLRAADLRSNRALGEWRDAFNRRYGSR